MKIRILLLGMFFLLGIFTPVWAVFCSSCGNQAPDDARFCAQCGRPMGAESQSSQPPSLTATVVGSYPVHLVEPAPQAFQVTSHYLLINGYRIYRNSFFWIAEVSGSRARVWTVSEPPFNELIMGWVSLSELEKRSTLTPGTGIYCIEPPPPAARIVVIERPPFWQKWGFFSGNRRNDHHHHDRRRP